MFNSDQAHPLFNWIRLICVMLFLFLLAATLYTFRATGNIGKDTPPTSTISVTGTSDVYAVPDTATFSFGATATAKTVADAQKQVTDKVNAAIAALKKAGIDAKDIKNTDYSVNPHYEYPQIYCIKAPCPSSNQTLTGYDVTQTVEVKVRDTANVGSIIGQLGSLELTNVSGVSFTIDNEDALKETARAQAIDQAKAKAEKLADELGVSLGRITSFSENGNYPIYYAKGMMSADSMAVPASAPTPELPTGQNKITSNVNIMYEIR